MIGHVTPIFYTKIYEPASHFLQSAKVHEPESLYYLIGVLLARVIGRSLAATTLCHAALVTNTLPCYLPQPLRPLVLLHTLVDFTEAMDGYSASWQTNPTGTGFGILARFNTPIGKTLHNPPIPDSVYERPAVDRMRHIRFSIAISI